ncbi:apolipoprotein N-acyltransferase [bacterium]|nr:apolipoprotein N-acyltransferase [bacterium]
MNKKSILLIIFSGILFGLAFPPLQLGFLAYFALIPLLFALANKTKGQGFILGYLFGLIRTLLLIWWVSIVTFWGMIGACILLGVFTGFFGMVYSWIYGKNKTVAFFSVPFLWVAMEYALSVGEISFPWLNIAYSQSYYLPLIQFADILGSLGVSFWLVIINLVIFYAISKFSLKRLVLAVILLILLFGFPLYYGYQEMQRELEGESLRIALLQGNVDPYRKWDKEFKARNMEIYLEMIGELDKSGLDLIVLPETATASYIAHDRRFRRRLHELTDSLNIPILTGTLDYKAKSDGQNIYYNASALFLPRSRIIKFFYKTILVPFSEHLPFEEQLRVLKKIDAGQGNFTPGNKLVVFEIPAGRFCTPICFEAAFEDLIREFVNRGAEFMVTITNDGWFGVSSGPYQHARISVFRAIENRIPVARAANTGISLFIDPLGRVLKASKLNEKTAIIADIPTTDKTTFFTRHGQIVPWISVLYAQCVLLWALLFKK